jgi:large subunit ribosomal protein L2
MNCKKLIKNLIKSGGKNNLGLTTILTKSGGNKKKYRFIDFKRNNLEIGYVLRIEKDPNRTSYIALICYLNGSLSYIIASEMLKIGTIIENFNKKLKFNNFIPGNSNIIKFLPIGSIINNIEVYPNLGSVLVRAAGTFAQIVKKYNDYYFEIKLRSGEHRLINKNCRVVLGIVSNIYNNQLKLYKAGQSRYLGIKPKVRGRAMNPVDHPHGGRTNGGISPRTPSGKLTKFVPTRNVNKLKNSKFVIINKRFIK